MLGYCTTLDGDAVQYVLSHGLPEWSREHIAGLARCGGASATSETTDGRGEGHGSVAVCSAEAFLVTRHFREPPLLIKAI